jgi:hypothetical protein
MVNGGIYIAHGISDALIYCRDILIERLIYTVDILRYRLVDRLYLPVNLLADLRRGIINNLVNIGDLLRDFFTNSIGGFCQLLMGLLNIPLASCQASVSLIASVS